LWLYDRFIVVWLPQGMELEEAAYLLYMVSFWKFAMARLHRWTYIKSGNVSLENP
jgi:hypothetical protein